MQQTRDGFLLLGHTNAQLTKDLRNAEKFETMGLRGIPNRIGSVQSSCLL